MVVWAVNARSFLYSSYDDFENETLLTDVFPIPQLVALDSPEVDLVYPIPDPADPSQNGNGNIDFSDPDNISNEVIYDPESGTYQINSTMGDMNYRPPTYMTQEEYINYDMEQALQDYWNSKVAEDNEAEANGGESWKPDLGFEVKGLGDIFGSNRIDIRPQGSAELKFGINISRTDNPQIPERQRRITTFDFDEQIQLNVTGIIGEKLKLQTSYNTEATFDFENQMKLEYTGFEDEIIKKIEAGNVSLPLSGSLIKGANSLFGIKSELQFGRATVTSIFSQQKGERKDITVQGGAQQSEFEVPIDQYEVNKHYFLNYYHRQNYDQAMSTLPLVSSGVNITRMEVWVTNRTNDFTETRNVIGFTDLGENNVLELAGGYGLAPDLINPLPRNGNNGLYDYVSNNSAVRGFVNSSSALSTGAYPMTQAVHYEKLENARMLTAQEYTYNAQLGFISLNQALNNDEVLCVAYQYTHNGTTYQVGEFSTDGVAGTDALLLKLLKPTITNPKRKLWDLMMKNVYSLGAYQVSPQNFRLDVWYNNPKYSVENNYIDIAGLKGKPLVQLVKMDRYDAQSQDRPDGVFDFIPISANNGVVSNGGTINTRNGRVYFTTVEPFGSGLNQSLIDEGIDTNTRATIVYQPLYDSTQTAARQIPELNRFAIKGTYESSVGSEISLNALNIPRGSVQVTAGGRQLVEGQDYTVDYNLGRVRILDESVLSSGTPINVSLESNSLFSIQQKTLMGAHMDYRVNKDFNLGATIMNLTERPLTQKVNIGDEPISNTIFGIDGTWRKEVPFLTKLVDKIPLINTKEKSTLAFTGEGAYLLPGVNRAIGKDGTSYIDDFEGSQSAIDIRSFNTWVISSVPQGQPDLFPEAAYTDDLRTGFNRAKTAWYVIDPLFFRNNNLTPSNIANNNTIQHDHRQREVLTSELFPNMELGTGQPTNIAVFDVAYYPNERGPYNFDDGSDLTISTGLDTAGFLNDPDTRWGGIMRPLTTNDFEAANIEYIQFWMMDPFQEGQPNAIGELAENDDSENTTGGELYFNIGNISEDINKDGSKAFENGLPTDGQFDSGILRVTNWGWIPTTQVIVNAFDNDLSVREFQDVGLDGIPSNSEGTIFTAFRDWVTNPTNGLTPSAISNITNDLSADDYTYYRDDEYDQLGFDVLQRYKKYNGLEGNSPTTEQSAQINSDGYPTSATTLPNVEDINQDNNLNETEAYFQYKIDLKPQNMVVGQNYIADRVLGVHQASGKDVWWYQFKIPLAQYEKAVNGIQDFRSIRFMRMFMKGFSQPLVMRFARLELIRGEWRRYNQDLFTPGDYIQDEEANTVFNIGAVNIEQNDNYQIPPGIQRQVNVQTQNLAQLNEQSMELEVCGLQDGDARAAFRNATFDVLSYKKLRMFIHAHSLDIMDPISDNEVTCFIRLGTDFENNYYEYEVPLIVSDENAPTADELWPTENNVIINFETLKSLKIQRGLGLVGSAPVTYADPEDPTRNITIVGNPSLQNIKTIMIGVRNPWKDDPNNKWQPDDGEDKCVEVWVNELRLTDFDDFGGWAAQARATAQFADFANIALAGNISTPGFGSIEKRISERQRETIKGYDGSATIQLGKFFGNKGAVQLPMYIGQSEMYVDPMFDPLNPDILMASLDAEERKERQKVARDLTKRRSINFTNVKVNLKKEGAKPHFWDLNNLTATYAYNETFRRDINTQYNLMKNYNANLSYAYSPNSKAWKPFDKVKAFRKSKWLKPIKDFNLYLKPKSVGFNNTIDRIYQESEIRGNYGALTIPQYFKQFNWRRTYNMKYDVTKALKVDFNANNQAFIDEYDDEGLFTRINRGVDYYEDYKREVKNSIRNWGTTTTYDHNVNINYQWPLNKFPLTDWINVSTRYSVAYNWARAPLAQTELGNTIQNSRTVNWNGQLNMTNLYNKIPYLKKVNQKYGRKGGKGRAGMQSRMKNLRDKANNKDDEDEDDKDKDKKDKKDKENSFNILEQSARVLMMLKNVNLTYSTTDGLLLPGYNQSINAFGMSPGFDAPGYKFVLGGHQRFDLFGDSTQSDFARDAALAGWLIDSTNSRILNTQFTSNHRVTLNGKATIEPINGFKINLSIDRNYSLNNTANFRWTDSVFDPDLEQMVFSPDYRHQNPINSGTFSTSIITWRTAFESDTSNSSTVFTDLRNRRSEVSQILGDENPNSVNPFLENGDYADGYDESQQDVIIGAFISAYTGKKPTKNNINPLSAIPLPNWRISYDGLKKIPFIGKHVKQLTFSHAYRSSYTVGNFTTNLNARKDGGGNMYARDVSGNLISETQIITASIMEQFAPLLGFDAVLKNSMRLKLEYKKDRNISLSLTNNQITEIKGNVIEVGSGYKFEQVKFPFEIGGTRPISDLDIRADVSIRSNKTITRKIIENQNQVTSGQRMVSIKCTANYKLGKALTLRAYFDRVVTNPFVSTSFPTANTNAGFALRFTLS